MIFVADECYATLNIFGRSGSLLSVIVMLGVLYEITGNDGSFIGYILKKEQIDTSIKRAKRVCTSAYTAIAISGVLISTFSDLIFK